MVVTLGDGHAATEAERFGSDFQSDRKLLPFVLVSVNHAKDTIHQKDIGSGFFYNLSGRQIVFNVSKQYGIQCFIGRKTVRILPIWSQFRAGWFRYRMRRNQFTIAIHMRREIINHCFGHIRNNRQSAAGIPV